MNKLDQFEALEKAATAGPWVYTEGIAHKHYVASSDEREEFSLSLQSMHWNDGKETRAEWNAQLIAAARNLAPHLIRLARVADDCADKLALLRDLSDTEAYVSRALNAALAPLLAEVRE